jgi:hypothetical protein
VVVVPQMQEIVEGDHFQVGPGENLWQLHAGRFENTYSRQLLEALSDHLLLALSLFLRCRVVSGHAIVNFAFLGLAEIEDAASILAVNENGGFRVGALPVLWSCGTALRRGRLWHGRLPAMRHDLKVERNTWNFEYLAVRPRQVVLVPRMRYPSSGIRGASPGWVQ